LSFDKPLRASPVIWRRIAAKAGSGSTGRGSWAEGSSSIRRGRRS